LEKKLHGSTVAHLSTGVIHVALLSLQHGMDDSRRGVSTNDELEITPCNKIKNMIWLWNTNGLQEQVEYFRQVIEFFIAGKCQRSASYAYPSARAG